MDLVTITRKAFDEALSRFFTDYNAPVPFSNPKQEREFNQQVLRRLADAKLAYWNALWVIGRDNFDLIGRARRKEVYVNKHLMLAETKDRSGNMAFREYQPGSLALIVQRDSRDEAYNKYAAMYCESGQRFQSLHVGGLAPWKTQRQMLLESLAHRADGVNGEDDSWGRLLFIGGSLYGLGYSLAVAPSVLRGTADVTSLNMNYWAVCALIFGGLGLMRRARPSPLYESKDSQKTIKVNRVSDQDALYLLQSALPALK